MQADNSNSAFILALLTAGGGITGYVRTGSIPSVTAGCTVGALVCCHSLFCISTLMQRSTRLEDIGFKIVSRMELNLPF